MVNPRRPIVVLALPAPSYRGPVPQRRPPGPPAPPATPAPTGVVVNAGEVDRALPVVPARGAVRRRQRQVPTGIVARPDEVVVPVALPPQNQAQEEPEEKKSLLPEGTPLLLVAGEKLPKSAVGPALEFLEFFSAFYESLEMKEAEGEWTLHEIVKGCKLNKGGLSPVARIHVRLLSVILDASDEWVSPRSENKNSWLKVLKSYLDEKKQPRPDAPLLKDAEDKEIKAMDADAGSMAISIPTSSTAISTAISNAIANAISTTIFTKPSPSPSDAVASSNVPPSNAVATFSPFQESVHRYATALEDGANGYLSLAVEEKLQLLTILCNDALSTTVIRGHIDKVKNEYDEKRKEEKGKEKIKDGESKASAPEPSTEDKRTGSVRTRSAHKQASANLPETFESFYSFHTETFRSDALKTEAIVWENGSHALWKLKGGDDRTAVICRVISDIEGTPKEEWTVYSEKDEVDLAAYLDLKKYV